MYNIITIKLILDIFDFTDKNYLKLVIKNFSILSFVNVISNLIFQRTLEKTSQLQTLIKFSYFSVVRHAINTSFESSYFPLFIFSKSKNSSETRANFLTFKSILFFTQAVLSFETRAQELSPIFCSDRLSVSVFVITFRSYL